MNLRAALNNDAKKPYALFIEGEPLCFAVIKKNGRIRLVPGTDKRAALQNLGDYRARETCK